MELEKKELRDVVAVCVQRFSLKSNQNSFFCLSKAKWFVYINTLLFEITFTNIITKSTLNNLGREQRYLLPLLLFYYCVIYHCLQVVVI